MRETDRSGVAGTEGRGTAGVVDGSLTMVVTLRMFVCIPTLIRNHWWLSSRIMT